MRLVIAENQPAVAYTLMLALLTLLIGGLLLAWLLGRMLGSRSNWRAQIDRDRRGRSGGSDTPAADAWTESGRRARTPPADVDDEPDADRT